MLLFCGQVMLSKGPKRGIARELQHPLINTDSAYLACVVGPQSSKHPGRQGGSWNEAHATGANAEHSACACKRQGGRVSHHQPFLA